MTNCAGALTLALTLAGCGERGPPRPIPAPPAPTIAAPPAMPEPEVRATIAGGEAPPPAMPSTPSTEVKRGDIAVNFPAADVQVVAASVLGSILGVPYTIAPDVRGPVSLTTPGPVARSSLIGLFETALRNAGFALTSSAAGYRIQTIAAAQAEGPVAPGTAGYGSEVFELRFINADELKTLLDSVIPGVVITTNPGRNALTIAGTSGQRGSARDIIAQFDVNWLRNMSFGLFVPERTDARLIVPELEKLINAPDAPTRGLVRLIAMERLNGILAVSNQRQYLDDVRRWIEILDREGASGEPRLFVYHMQNGRSRDLVRTLNTALGIGGGGGTSATDSAGSSDSRIATPQAPGGAPTPAPLPADAGGVSAPGGAGRRSALDVTISSDEVNNAVIVYGTPRDYAVVEAALRQLDITPAQVMIEAAITEVSLTDDLRYGVQWNFQTGDSNFALSEGTTANPTRILPGFSYFFSNNNDISATLNALEKRTNIKVVSAPKLMVLNNQTAALQVGDQVPVSTQSAVSVQNPDAPIVNAIEYRDTGVILKVTPRVNASGLVLMDIAQEVSDVATNQVSGIDSPTISTRRVSTSIAVQDGQVIVLGGLFRDSRSFGKNGLPILSRIPILGSLLFGNANNTQRRTELIILIKPHVVRSIEDGRAVSEELRAKLRTLEPFRTQGQIP